jgi:hypothetical protein
MIDLIQEESFARWRRGVERLLVQTQIDADSLELDQKGVEVL